MSDHPATASLLATLGLRTTASSPTPNYAASYIIGNWFFAHGILNPRAAIRRLGQDPNNAPRENLLKYGEAAVQAGKITRGQLNRLKRREAAHLYQNILEAKREMLISGIPDWAEQSFSPFTQVSRPRSSTGLGCGFRCCGWHMQFQPWRLNRTN